MPRPYLSEIEFVNRVESAGYSLREGQLYIGVQAKYSVVCPHHPENSWLVLGSNLANRKAKPTCPVCSDRSQSEAKSFSHDHVVSLFYKDSRGFKIREGWKYTCNKDKISIVCPDHPSYEWITRPLDVLSKQKRCPVCLGKAPLSNEVIDSRLTGRNIKRISDYAGRSSSWMTFCCEVDGHEWKTSVSKVLNDLTGCPKCSNRVPWTNSRVDELLKEEHPSLIRYDAVFILGGKAKVKLRCAVDGYEWVSEISNLQNGYGCPCCRTQKYWNTELAAVWLAEHRPDIEVLSLDGVSKKSNFFCKTHGKTFQQKFNYIRQGYGCDECSDGGGFKKRFSGHLYYAKIFVGNMTLYKIGITNRKPQVRISETRHRFELLKSYEFSEGAVADHLESVLLFRFKHLIQNEHKFSGSTECFTEDIENYIDLDEFVLQLQKD